MAHGIDFCPPRANNYNVFCIRCWGKEGVTKNYLVWGIDNTLHTQPPYDKPFYRLMVNESTQVVTVTDIVSGNIIFQGAGGLHNSSEEMLVTSTMNNHNMIGTINDQRICITVEPGADNLPTNWYIGSLDDKNAVVVQDGKYMDIFRVWGNSKAAAVAIKVADPDAINESLTKKTMITLMSLKLYYSVYRYAIQPVPCGMLGNTQQGIPFPPNLSIFEPLQQIRLRHACVNSNGDYFYDLLDATTHRICLIAVRTILGGLLMVRDTFRRTQFTVHVDEIHGEEVYLLVDSFVTPFGKISKKAPIMHDSVEANCNSSIAENKKNPSPLQQSEGEVRELNLQTQLSTSTIAEYYQEKGAGTVVINFAQGLDKLKKALVLTRAILVSMSDFRIGHEGMVPKVADYPYLKE